MIRRFQVYGERCCGTNYVIRLLERNVTSARFTEEFGFKHWFPDEDLEIPDDTLVIIVKRNLLDSLHSLHRRPWHAHESLRGCCFSEFIRKRWHCIWDDEFWGMAEGDEGWQTEMMHERNPFTGERFPNVIEMIAAKNRIWEKLVEVSAHGIVVEYDDIRTRPESFLSDLASRFGLSIRLELRPVNDYKGEKAEAYVPKIYPETSAADLTMIEDSYRKSWDLIAGLSERSHSDSPRIPIHLGRRIE